MTRCTTTIHRHLVKRPQSLSEAPGLELESTTLVGMEPKGQCCSALGPAVVGQGTPWVVSGFQSFRAFTKL